MPTSARVQRDGVVDAVAEERDVDAGAPRDLDRAAPSAPGRRARRSSCVGIAAASASSSSAVDLARRVSDPVDRRGRGRGRPWPRRSPLSPVMTFTAMPRRVRAARSTRPRRPSAGRRRRGSRRAAGRARRRPRLRRVRGAARVADRDHAARRRRTGASSTALRLAAGTSTQRASTASGAPLRDQRRAPSRVVERRPTRAGARGRTAAVRDARAPRAPSAVSDRGPRPAPQSARSSAFPPTGPPCVDASPRCRRARAGARRRSRRPAASSASWKRDRALGQRAGLVGEEHLDVAEVLDASRAA